MKTEQKIPFGISDYIKKHFKEDFLFDVKEVKKMNGDPLYVAEVSKDNFIHKLKFNKDGTLVTEDTRESFPSDIHEEQSFGDVPE
jgi:hypothetical protein